MLTYILHLVYYAVMEQMLIENLSIAQNPYDEGVVAYWDKKETGKSEPNPYREATESFTQWVQGWFEAAEYDS